MVTVADRPPGANKSQKTEVVTRTGVTPITSLSNRTACVCQEQQEEKDGARPHTGQDLVNRLNVEGAFGFPQIKVITQPAQSLDLNICNLAFFRALATAVRKQAATWAPLIRHWPALRGRARRARRLPF